MVRRFVLIVLLLVALPHGTYASAAPSESSADVVVYGGSSAGVIAAVQSARMGKTVILIEPGKFIGGLTAGGLGMTDTGVDTTIGGTSREFYERIYRYYTQPAAWKTEKREDYLSFMPKGWAYSGKPTDESKIQFVFEPSAATTVFKDMLREAGVQLVTQQRIDRTRGVGVKKDGWRIASIKMDTGQVYSAKVFIDATYEGDLMATAGVTYTTGREANTVYGETFNGILPSGALPFPRVSPYIVPGDPTSGLLPRVEPRPPGPVGAGDARQQAYNFRVCITNVPDNRVPFEKPANYDPLHFELLARWITTMKVPPKPGTSTIGLVALAGDNKNLVLSFHRVPNLKTDSNVASEFGTDYLGRSWAWADGDYATREALWQEHKDHIQGLLWFLANDPRCPEPVRTEMQKWGLAKDEFVENGNWPFQLYVREARRMISDYVMTEHDARGARVAEDPVALASYTSDSHGVTLFLNEKGVLCREKGFFVRTGVFPISYRAIRPRRGEGDNLIVPTALSSSHAAFGPMRMEPVFMMLGQAAGTAASLAIDEKTTVQDLPYEKLRDKLLADQAILKWNAVKGATTNTTEHKTRSS
jgi:hypothetical protein